MSSEMALRGKSPRERISRTRPTSGAATGDSAQSAATERRHAGMAMSMAASPPVNAALTTRAAAPREARVPMHHREAVITRSEPPTSRSASIGRTRDARREATRQPDRDMAMPAATDTGSTQACQGTSKPDGTKPKWRNIQVCTRTRYSPETDPRGRAEQTEERGFTEQQAPYLAPARPHETQEGQVLPSLGDGEGERRPDDEDRDEDREGHDHRREADRADVGIPQGQLVVIRQSGRDVRNGGGNQDEQ